MFLPHGRALEKKGTQVVLQLAQLAKTGWGIPLRQCLQLTTSLIHSRTDCAESVWHHHDKNTSTVNSIQCINDIAQCFTLRVFRTHPLVFLKHDTASPSALHRLNARAQKAMARLLILPDTNLAAWLARKALRKLHKTHRSCLNHTLHAPSSTLSCIPAPLKIVSLSGAQQVTPHPRIQSLIAPNKAAAAAFVRSQLRPIVKHNPTRAMSFSDGSLIPEEGVGVAAFHLPSCTVSPANLGDSISHTVYEAELVGIRMAADLALLHRTPLHRSFWFFIDNQPLIRALTQRLKATAGLLLRRQAVAAFVKLTNLSPLTTVTLVWCPAHVGIQENEDVDAAAKAATVSGDPQHLPTSLAAVKQQVNACSKASVTDTPSSPVLRRLRGVNDPVRTRKALAALPRHSATAVAQLRAGHTPLSAFLHRIGVVKDPNCSTCGQPETTEHFLLLYSKYDSERATFFKKLRRLELNQNLKVHDVHFHKPLPSPAWADFSFCFLFYLVSCSIFIFIFSFTIFPEPVLTVSTLYSNWTDPELLTTGLLHM